MEINIKNFSKIFRRRSFFIGQNVCIDLDNSKITFLTGNNGSGKSTLMKILAGLLQINTGAIDSPQKFLTWSKFHCYYLPASEKGLTHKLTGLENIIYLCSLKGNSKEETLINLKYFLKIFSFNDLLNMRVGEMSTGQKRIIHILAAFSLPCKVLLLDEPSIGLDDPNLNSFINFVQEYSKNSNRKFVIISHERFLREQLMEEEYFVDDLHNIKRR